MTEQKYTMPKHSVMALRDISWLLLRAAVTVDKVVSELRERGWEGGLEEIQKAKDEILNEKVDFESLKNDFNLYDSTRAHFFSDVPWVQPSPYGIEGVPATCLHVPEDEIKDFLNLVVGRYLKCLRSGWTSALAEAMTGPVFEVLTDAEFEHFIMSSSFSRFLRPASGFKDAKVFGRVVDPAKIESGVYYKMDLSPMADYDCYKGFYTTSTIVLFEDIGKNRMSVKAIQVGEHVFYPEDDDRWRLAKTYTIQNCSIILIFGTHPMVHFPVDTVTALTKAIFPKDHMIYRLFEPHMFMQLPLNYAVLYVDKSVFQNNQREIYTPFPGSNKGPVSLIKACFAGTSAQDSYPGYEFLLEPPVIHSEYGNFLKGYFEVVLKYVNRVLDTEENLDEILKSPEFRRWADECAHWIPGFPDSKKIQAGDTLARVLTSFIWTVSIVHSADHRSFEVLPLHKAPVRLRVPPPKPGVEVPPEKQWVEKEDLFRHRMAWEMYFRVQILTRLVDCTYAFENSKQKRASLDFIEDLKEYDRTCPVSWYSPLNDMAASIQF